MPEALAESGPGSEKPDKREGTVFTQTWPVAVGVCLVNSGILEARPRGWAGYHRATAVESGAGQRSAEANAWCPGRTSGLVQMETYSGGPGLPGQAPASQHPKPQPT